MIGLWDSLVRGMATVWDHLVQGCYVLCLSRSAQIERLYHQLQEGGQSNTALLALMKSIENEIDARHQKCLSIPVQSPPQSVSGVFSYEEAQRAIETPCQQIDVPRHSDGFQALIDGMMMISRAGITIAARHQEIEPYVPSSFEPDDLVEPVPEYESMLLSCYETAVRYEEYEGRSER